MIKKKETTSNRMIILLLITGVFLVVFFGYVLFRTYQSENSLLSIMTIPLILGIIFENRRLSTDWKMIVDVSSV